MYSSYEIRKVEIEIRIELYVCRTSVCNIYEVKQFYITQGPVEITSPLVISFCNGFYVTF